MRALRIGGERCGIIKKQGNSGRFISARGPEAKEVEGGL